MKLLVLVAVIAAVASTPLDQSNSWPWQVGKEYIYDVDTYTLTQYDHSDSNGNAFKAQFKVRVLTPGHLVAQLSKPVYAQVQEKKTTKEPFFVLPPDLKYQPIRIIEEPFEIFVDHGRVRSLRIPSTLSIAHENLLKGLISALQVDLTPFGRVYSFPNSYDKQTFQGLFKKQETDVTGECETQYVVSPVSAEWRRELPEFALEEDPVEIIKSKNFGSCKHRLAYHFGVPEGAVWNGIAYKNEEKQFIKHKSEMRVLASKQGTIFKSEVISTVFVSPLLFGKQKAEVYSYVKFYLLSVQDASDIEWKPTETGRRVTSLLFTMNESMFYPKARQQDIANIQRLLQDMTPLLQSPNKMSEADFLLQFNILVRKIAPFNLEQLNQLTSSIEIAKSSKNVAKTGMWIIYRDAVAQAGSTAAFEQIKSWILSKKVQGEEAAELISDIGASLRYPTKKILTEFFDFAMNPTVMEQQFLNNSALLAATNFLRFGQDNAYVVRTVIPRLFKELKNAIDENDSNKAQVYITVIGNLAHPEILKWFAPFLDGSTPVSKYLRTQIVASLKTLANTKNDQVRAVLYSILRNTAEAYEVRVAAALNIFMAFPTAEMMQIMAHMANVDYSTQVRAVLTNGITYAAKLKDPRFSELAKTAQSVLDILPKENFGYSYSIDSIFDEYTSDDDIAFFREHSFIGSNDNILPLYHRSALRERGTGWTEESQVTWSVSSVQKLMEYFEKMISDPKKSNIDLKYTAKDILEKLKIKREPRELFEGSLFLKYLTQQRLITFNEKDLDSFFANAIENIEQLITGVNIQYTKIFNSKKVYVVFPVATGMPFVFEYNEPLIYSARGQLKVKIDDDDDDDGSSNDFSGSFYNQLDFIYARNLDGSVGFLDTLGDVYAIAGVINKLQLYLPITLNTRVEPSGVKFNFVLPKEDTNFITFSVWPYISLQNIDSLVTVSENPSSKLVTDTTTAGRSLRNTNMKLGNLFGVSFLLEGHSYSSDYEDTKIYDTDFLTSIGNLLYQKNVALTQFDFKYLAEETKNKEVSFNLYYDILYNQKHSGEMRPAALVKDIAANSEGRREEFVKRAAAGIKSAEVQLFDISVVFSGEQNVEYVCTAALADSVVDNKIQGVFFFNGLEQINAVFKLIKPKIIPLNFKEAVKNKIMVTYEAELKYGNSDSIRLRGFGKRSDMYTKSMKSDPVAQQCWQETDKYNLFQNDCHLMIAKAHTTDYYQATVTYKELRPEFLNLTYDAYEIFRDTFLLKEEHDFSKTIEDGKIELEAQAFYNKNYVDYKITSKYGMYRFKNVEDIAYYPLNFNVQSFDWFSDYQDLRYCAIDDSKVWTFSGRSYDYSLTSSWHVVMVDESDDFGKLTDLVILARRPSDKQEEIYISYKNDDANYVELEINPYAVHVNTNTKKVSDGSLLLYVDSEEAPLLKFYTFADGVQMFDISSGDLRLMYDRQRLIIFTDDYRSYTRGICGQNTNQIGDDYLTPYGIVDRPDHYGASFSLESEFSDPKTEKLKKEAKLYAYQPVTRYTNILRSDSEWSNIRKIMSNKRL